MLKCTMRSRAVWSRFSYSCTRFAPCHRFDLFHHHFIITRLCSRWTTSRSRRTSRTSLRTMLPTKPPSRTLNMCPCRPRYPHFVCFAFVFSSIFADAVLSCATLCRSLSALLAVRLAWAQQWRRYSFNAFFFVVGLTHVPVTSGFQKTPGGSQPPPPRKSETCRDLIDRVKYTQFTGPCLRVHFSWSTRRPCARRCWRRRRCWPQTAGRRADACGKGTRTVLRACNPLLSPR